MTYVRHAVAALASACLFTACGGGGNNEPTAPTVTTEAAVTPSGTTALRLEGCVQPAGQRAVAVQALDGDGRLLATAIADANGVFSLQVPARQNVTLRVAAGGDAELELLTGSTNVSLTACLNANA